MTDVYSTIRTENQNGEMAPTLLGSVPDMESESALKALESAKKLLTGEKDSGLPCGLESG